ncbi:MAG: hypothetical protein ACKVQW_12965 [Pyrinomonadaceae bacterium]
MCAFHEPNLIVGSCCGTTTFQPNSSRMWPVNASAISVFLFKGTTGTAIRPGRKASKLDTIECLRYE